MNINTFFIIIIVALLSIYLVFKPQDQVTKDKSNLAILELEDFKTIELDTNGLSSTLEGTKALRYTRKYIIHNLDYTDNTDEYLSNLKSKKGIYKGQNINVIGDVIYSRADGLSFLTQKATYNQKTKIAKALTNYVSHMNGHTARGSWIEYNNILGTIKSKNIVANYKL